MLLGLLPALVGPPCCAASVSVAGPVLQVVGGRCREVPGTGVDLRSPAGGRTADSFAGAGFLPVVDDVVVRRAHLAFYRRQIAGGPLHFVVLAPGAAKAGERNLARDKTLTTDWSFLDTAMRTELAGEGVWIDNVELTVAETVDVVLAATGLTAC
ncbi:phosphotransferase [Streptomyces bacillaris]|uniref:phosphotransferase n=1 Tax=Streptomyces bacillaris TaxID=68179 RepID=UPI00345FC2BC